MNKFKKYENILSQINSLILNNEFFIKDNEDILQIIIEIYKYSKIKDLQNLNLKIEEFEKKAQEKNLYFDNIKNIKTRDWNIDESDENIEAFNSIEMVSWIFLQNIKNELWKQ